LRPLTFIALFDAGDIAPPCALAWTTRDDAARAASLAPQRRHAFLAARAVLRALLAEHGLAPSTPLRYGGFGKPCLAGVPEVRFSISHSGRTACVAVGADGEIGVDIECGAHVDDGAVMRRFFSAREADALASMPSGLRRRAFSEAWTRREAVLKAVGIGLGVDAEAFSLSVPPTPPAVVAARDVRFALPLSLHRIAAGDVVGTLAVAAPGAAAPQHVEARRLLLNPPRSTDRPDRSRARGREEGAA
jgi:4'-phosphopantetheinyl transferase